MRTRLIGLLAILGLCASCSSPPAEVRGAELRTVPPATAADTTLVPTTPSTAAPTTRSSTAPAETTTIAAASLKSEDELKIEYVITEFNRRDWAERVNRTFDIKVYDGLIEGRKLENVKQALANRKASTRYTLPGTILETVVVETKITGDGAVSISCERNDLQVWESSGTTDKSDDALVDDSLLIERLNNELQKRGDSWVITRTTDADGDCSAVF
jgi:hypothetical protein